MDLLRRISPVFAAGISVSVICCSLSATPTLTITSGATFSSTGGPCFAPSFFPKCTSTAYLSNDIATSTSLFISPGSFNGVQPTTQTFDTAFANWNSTHGHNWTLIDGGILDVTLNVSRFAASASSFTVGGISVVEGDLSFNAGYAGPLLSQLVWTQALYTNYTPDFSGAVFNTLDTFTLSGGPFGSGPFGSPCTPIPGPPNPSNNTSPSSIPNNINPGGQTAYCDPIYPFQGVGSGSNKSFGDAPMGTWNDLASFRGIALLSTATFKTDSLGNTIERDLTVYDDGISYGFDLSASVPEANTFSFLMIGMLMLVVRTVLRQ